MPYLIGTDEAGYGPNLGPLVITATVWEVPETARRVDLYRRLGKAVVNEPGSFQWGKLPLAIADSKLLYRPPDGLGLLERGVLACLGLMGSRVSAWREVWQLLEPDCLATWDHLPWHVDTQMALPLAADPADLAQIGPALQKRCERA